MTSLTWRDHFTANPPPYTQPEVIKNFYRDNPPDGSQFSTTGLRRLFETTHFTPTDPPQSDSPKQNATDTSAPKETASSNSTASIAGGVVGGAGCLAVIIGAAVYLYLRRKKRPVTPNASPVPVPSLYEADTDAEYKGAQLDSHEIHEMQHFPAEMAVGYGGACELPYDVTRYEMEAAERR
ncbi:MAG: hypothetical protein Q9208_008815 [Pyrenodesmia sp. 3 TL-2023]